MRSSRAVVEVFKRPLRVLKCRDLAKLYIGLV